MAQLIQIKRSAVTAIPVSLADGELAYSSFDNLDKLYIGAEGGIHTIGGKSFTDKVDLITIESLWEDDNPNVYRPTGDVGIGVVPEHKLHVKGAVESTIVKVEAGSAEFTAYLSDALNKTLLSSAAGDALALGIGGVDKLTVGADGNASLEHGLYVKDDIDANGAVKTLTAGQIVVDKDLCYLKDDGKYWRADASVVDTSTTELVMATETILANQEGVFRTSGSHAFTGLTVGAIYYASTTLAGITDIPPTGMNEVIRIVGYARSATELMFSPAKTYAVLATTQGFKDYEAGENIAAKDVCYLNTDGKMYRADASTEAGTAGFLALSDTSLNAAETGSFTKDGIIGINVTEGESYFLSTVPGAISTTTPSSTGEVVRLIGYGVSGTQFLLVPSNDYLTVG